MPDDEIIRLDPNEFEKMLNDDAVRKPPVRNQKDQKRKIEPAEKDSPEDIEKTSEMEEFLDDSEEQSTQKPKRTTKSRSNSEKKGDDADVKQLFGSLDSLLRKATIKSITRTLQDLKDYLDKEPDTT